MRTNILHQAKIGGCGKGLKGRFDLSGGLVTSGLFMTRRAKV